MRSAQRRRPPRPTRLLRAPNRTPATTRTTAGRAVSRTVPARRPSPPAVRGGWTSQAHPSRTASTRTATREHERVRRVRDREEDGERGDLPAVEPLAMPGVVADDDEEQQDAEHEAVEAELEHQAERQRERQHGSQPAPGRTPLTAYHSDAGSRIDPGGDDERLRQRRPDQRGERRHRQLGDQVGGRQPGDRRVGRRPGSQARTRGARARRRRRRGPRRRW